MYSLPQSRSCWKLNHTSDFKSTISDCFTVTPSKSLSVFFFSYCLSVSRNKEKKQILMSLKAYEVLTSGHLVVYEPNMSANGWQINIYTYLPIFPSCENSTRQKKILDARYFGLFMSFIVRKTCMITCQL